MVFVWPPHDARFLVFSLQPRASAMCIVSRIRHTARLSPRIRHSAGTVSLTFGRRRDHRADQRHVRGRDRRIRIAHQRQHLSAVTQ